MKAIIVVGGPDARHSFMQHLVEKIKFNETYSTEYKLIEESGSKLKALINNDYVCINFHTRENATVKSLSGADRVICVLSNDADKDGKLLAVLNSDKVKYEIYDSEVADGHALDFVQRVMESIKTKKMLSMSAMSFFSSPDTPTMKNNHSDSILTLKYQ